MIGLQNIIAVALIVDLLTQWVVSILGKFMPKTTVDRVAYVFAYILGLATAFLFQVDMFVSVGLTNGPHFMHFIGVLLTGLVSGRGGHFINQVLQEKLITLKIKKPEVKCDEETL